MTTKSFRAPGIWAIERMAEDHERLAREREQEAIGRAAALRDFAFWLAFVDRAATRKVLRAIGLAYERGERPAWSDADWAAIAEGMSNGMDRTSAEAEPAWEELETWSEEGDLGESL